MQKAEAEFKWSLSNCRNEYIKFRQEQDYRIKYRKILDYNLVRLICSFVLDSNFVKRFYFSKRFSVCILQAGTYKPGITLGIP